VAADDALNYCGGSAVVLRIIRSIAADGSQYCCKWFALLRETTVCNPRNNCV